MTTTLRRDTMMGIPGTAIPGLASFTAFVLIGHLAGERTLGYVSLAWITANLVSAVTALGPAQTALRTVNMAVGHPTRNEQDTISRYRTLVLQRSLVASALVLGVAAITTIFSRPMGLTLAMSAPWLLGQAWVLFEAETLKATSRFGNASFLLSSRAVIGWSAAVGAAALGGGLGAIVLPTAVVGLVAGGVASRNRFLPVTDEVRNSTKTIGRPISRLAVASYALGYADRYIVQALLGPIAVATYALGYQLGEGSIELITQPITGATMPRVVRQWHDEARGGKDAALRTTRRAGAVVIGISVIAPVVALALAPTGIYKIIGSSPDLPEITAIVSVAVGIQALTRLAYGILLAKGRTDRILSMFVRATALSLVVVPLLTWRNGVLGAAWATLIGYGFLAILTIRSAARS